MDYEKMYHILFNAITDSLDCIFRRDLEGGVSRLMEAQRETEELYLEQEQESKRARWPSIGRVFLSG